MAAVGRALRLAGAALLALALFLPWSHQFSPGFLARFGASPALRGVPHAPDAWQLFTFADVLLAALAAGLAATGLRSPRHAWPWLAGVGLAAAFIIHALLDVPTNGANLFDPALRGYAPPGASAGAGEWVALAGLALAAGGVIAWARARPPTG